MITQAFKEFVKVNEKKRGKVSVKEKLAEFRELLGKDKNRERAREHQKDRGQQYRCPPRSAQGDRCGADGCRRNPESCIEEFLRFHWDRSDES